MLRKDLFGWLGIAVGSIALLMAMLHFYAGPFSPQPTLESIVASKAVAIKESVLASLAGNSVAASVSQPRYDLDRILEIMTAVLAAAAVILGVIGSACRVNRRIVSGALMLGTGTLAFQFAVFAFGVIAVIFLIAVVLWLIMGG
ncbi:hypothetical protein Z042_06045 [Chania multitudinisentens RB-25]|uniref:Inner membrane protein yidI n=1 Tax=Chania multitudinisentens RB-25 TaxID=1441930 RepID=W0LAC5_9GAMM|nr:hypothetical protein [Chania multitudinisentens]AHG19227.1 hypothetical protein Z042_06045 [Chania multitudinisentens RB-25]